MHVAVVVCCLYVSFGAPDARLSEQEVQTLRRGMRLRVAAPAQAAEPIVGRLVADDSSFLTMVTSKGRIAVRREAIQTLWRSEQRSRKKKGALIGAALGLGIAAVLAATDKQEGFALSSEPLFSRVELALLYSVLSVPAGAGVGALVAPGERWVVMPDSIVGVAHSERRRGLQFGVRIRF
jgi:hypothetical protein